MDLIRTTAADTEPPAGALDLAAILSDEEWDELMSVARHVDPADPEWGLPWKRAPILLSY